MTQNVAKREWQITLSVWSTVELRFNEVQGTGEIGSLYQGFVISRLFSIHYAITGLKNVARYTEDFFFVSAHPYCARNPLRDVMPRHALSARAVEEMWRYITLVGTLIYMGLTLLNVR